MCHPSCVSCHAASDEYFSCTSCQPSRFMFFNTCLCPQNTQENSDYSCSELNSSSEVLLDLLYTFQLLTLLAMLASLFLKRSLPLTRKYIDINQTIGTFIFFNKYFTSVESDILNIYRISNIAPIIPNFIGQLSYGERMNPLSESSRMYLNTNSINQDPQLKFVMNGKSSNFLINQLQVCILWIIGYCAFCLFGVVLRVLRKCNSIRDYIKNSSINYIYIAFYLTAQETLLNIFLQIKDLSLNHPLNVISVIAMILYIALCFVLIRKIIFSQNVFPEDTEKCKKEIIRRSSDCHFVCQFETIVTFQTLELKAQGIQTQFWQFITTNWMVWMLIQKIFVAAVVTIRYKTNTDISMVIVILVFGLLFLITRPFQNKYQITLQLIADGYAIIIVCCLDNKAILGIFLLIGILLFNIVIIIEIILSERLYPRISKPASSPSRVAQMVTILPPSSMPRQSRDEHCLSTQHNQSFVKPQIVSYQIYEMKRNDNRREYKQGLIKTVCMKFNEDQANYDKQSVACSDITKDDNKEHFKMNNSQNNWMFSQDSKLLRDNNDNASNEVQLKDIDNSFNKSFIRAQEENQESPEREKIQDQSVLNQISRIYQPQKDQGEQLEISLFENQAEESMQNTLNHQKNNQESS